VQMKLSYFCAATASFMDLCDDLQQLAERVSTAKIPEDWNRLLGDLKDIVTRDVNTDFAKPAVAAVRVRGLLPQAAVRHARGVDHRPGNSRREREAD